MKSVKIRVTQDQLVLIALYDEFSPRLVFVVLYDRNRRFVWREKSVCARPNMSFCCTQHNHALWWRNKHCLRRSSRGHKQTESWESRKKTRERAVKRKTATGQNYVLEFESNCRQIVKTRYSWNFQCERLAGILAHKVGKKLWITWHGWSLG